MDLTRKPNLFIYLFIFWGGEGCSWLKFNNMELAISMALKFCTNVAKGLKPKDRKF